MSPFSERVGWTRAGSTQQGRHSISGYTQGRADRLPTRLKENATRTNCFSFSFTDSNSAGNRAIITSLSLVVSLVFDYGTKKKGKLLIRILSARGVTVPNSKAPCVWRRSLVAPAATLCWVFTDHMPLVRLTLQTQNKALFRETNNILKDVVVERLQILRMRG